MKTIMKFEDTDTISATLSITMSLKEWKELNGQLNNSWPSGKLSEAVTDLLLRANKTLIGNIPNDAN